MIDWVAQQLEKNISQWDNSIERYYPKYLEYWRNPKKHLDLLENITNNLDAVKLINWDKYICNENTKVLDFGGGTGWLSAYLSLNKYISSIIMLDSSKLLIETMVPGIINLMNGNEKKIKCVRGLFSPLLFDDNSFDVVVASAALHHSDCMEDVLLEINRVLKKKGLLIIINETPYSNIKYVWAVIKQFIKILIKTSTKKYISKSPSISSSGYLYDPFLGDKTYPEWYWIKAIEKSGFICIEKQNTALKPLKVNDDGENITHFICSKV